MPSSRTIQFRVWEMASSSPARRESRMDFAHQALHKIFPKVVVPGLYHALKETFIKKLQNSVDLRKILMEILS